MGNSLRGSNVCKGQSKSSRNSLTSMVWFGAARVCTACRVTGHFYVQYLQTLRDAVRRKRWERSRGSGFCITITHRATDCLSCSNSSLGKTFLSLLNHRTFWNALRVTLGCSLLRIGSQWDTFRNDRGHEIECDGRTVEDSEISLPPVLPTMSGSMEQYVCLFVCVSERERQSKCPTLKVIR
jgi:hypothetical protein